MEQNPNTSLFSLNLDAQNSYTLRSTASWARVLGVVSIIVAGLMVVYGIMAQQRVSRYNSYNSYRRSAFDTDTFSNMGLAVLIITALIYGLSGMFALNAGNKISTGLKTNNLELLNSGFAGARNFFALWAILMIIFTVLMLLGLLGSM
ncbi:MAG TPA: hypothetical protein VMZ03_13685 [Chitinophagaceae bacterium]|nr:hypothetical protein [Chitinophagaceae bacterium]